MSQQRSILPEKTCTDCGYRGARGVVRRCPRCGGALHTERELALQERQREEDDAA